MNCAGLVNKILIVIALTSLVSCSQEAKQDYSKQANSEEKVSRTVEQQLGTSFVDKGPTLTPRVQHISFEQFDFINSMESIWGATGRDDQGNIYFAMSGKDFEGVTAELIQFNPYSEQLRSLSNPISQLRRLGMDEPEMRQNKIHSKIIQADDGYLYFASYDGSFSEKEQLPPVWGGHLWRTKPGSDKWEHLFATPDAPIALQVAGRYVYAVAFWGQVLYQYDITSGRHFNVKLQSKTAHISRNFVVDRQANAYIPKVNKTENGLIYATLEQYDRRLNWVASYTMPNYYPANWGHYHGITGFAELANGDVYFVTQEGRLYKINAQVQGLNKLQEIGFIHPEGKASVESLFALDGENFLGAVARNKKSNYAQWLRYDIAKGSARITPLDKIRSNMLVYGSVTRDNEGAIYVAGSHWKGLHGTPKVWKISL